MHIALASGTPLRFSVLLGNGRSVAMTALPSTTPGALILVDRAAFLSAWSVCLNPQQRALARGDESTWRADRKFRDAEEGFAACGRSPVPVTDLLIGQTDDAGARAALVLDNGVTRTIWLLANGAGVLPFRCDAEVAEAVEEIAGARPEAVRQYLGGDGDFTR